MNQMSFRPNVSAARSVNRALGDLRRGVAVVLKTESGERWVALPAETATAATLAEFRSASELPAMMVLGATLGAGASVGDRGAVAVPVAMEGLTIDRLHALAEPMGLPRMANADFSAETPSVPARDVLQAALELVKLARLLPAMLVGTLRDLGAAGGLLAVHVTDVLAYPSDTAEHLVQAAIASVPLDAAPDARIVAFRPPDGGIEHLAILIGRPEDAAEPLVRVHSECFTGDLLGSRRCDCGPQLHQALRRMAAEGAGVLLYMAQEGRGIGLVNKLRAYTLQDAGLDTLDANRALGYGADERSFAAAAAMLRNLGVRRVRLLTNNPEKIAGLTAHGIEVIARIAHAIPANGIDDRYLETKRHRFGHLPG